MTAIETITDPAVELELVRSELEAFRRKVRRRAIAAFHDGDWCLQGLNDALVEIGLERYVGAGKWTGTAKLTALVESNTRGGVLTRENALDFLKVVSDDSEVIPAADDATVIDFRTSEEDELAFHVTVQVSFIVLDQLYQESAEDWARSGLSLEWTTHYLSINEQEIEIHGMTEESDPDRPDGL